MSQIVCSKCGSSFDRLTIEYKDRCYAQSCDWEDRDVHEHLHMICPICGYKTAEACADYADQKARFAREVVTTRYPTQGSLYPTHQSRVASAWDTGNNLD